MSGTPLRWLLAAALAFGLGLGLRALTGCSGPAGSRRSSSRVKTERSKKPKRDSHPDNRSAHPGHSHAHPHPHVADSHHHHPHPHPHLDGPDGHHHPY